MKGRPDYIIAITVFILMLFGLVMISSASAIISHENFEVNDYYFWRQLVSLGVALVIWFVCQSVPLKAWQVSAPLIMLISFATLIAVFVPGIGSSYGTASSWLDIGFLPNIQPAEYAKFALILFLAYYFQHRGKEVRGFAEGFIPFALFLAVVTGLIMAQPDFGTSLIVILIAVMMYFVAGANPMHLLFGGVLGGALFLTVVRQKAYIMNRFLAFLDPAVDPLGIGYHIQQSLIAIGSGGILGHGFGNSRQKFEYLPEAQGDSIFAITSEELGFIGVIVLLIAFTIIALRGFRIARRVEDPFAKLVATGITSWITFQALINMGVNLALMPTTGVPLPFISYGGSSLVASTAAIGVLLHISQYAYHDSTVRRGQWGASDATASRGRTTLGLRERLRNRRRGRGLSAT